ncbi:MAG: 1-acyl-sn-glycerol-3-phosphate acyltransferase [Methylococcales bacterium]|nr:1-acyl-sn-glycerol-3-phosphate acyltransferase [Methylococcales bacterium]
MKVRLNYVWRLFATGFSFVAFGVGGLLLSVFIFPVIRGVSADQQQKERRSQLSVHTSFYVFIGLMHRLGVMTYDIKGLEQLNRPGQLIIANHPTLIDIVFLISRLPYASCIVKDALWKNPFIKGSVSNTGYISNGQSEQMIQDCARYLQDGGILVIFPEGTRSVKGADYRFQRGAARIALQAKTVLTPVTIRCTPSTLTKQEKWYQIPHCRFHLEMCVGDDIVLDDFLAIEPKTVAVRRLNYYLQDYFSQQRIKE